MNDHDTMLSRALGARVEKLTIVSPLSVRLTEEQLRDVQGLAELRGMEKGEYIRHLVAQDKLEQENIWKARNQLFSVMRDTATNTARDKV